MQGRIYTRAQPLDRGGKEARDLLPSVGHQDCLVELPTPPSQSPPATMATRGFGSAQKRLQIPSGSSQTPGPTSSISHLPPSTGGPGVGTLTPALAALAPASLGLISWSLAHRVVMKYWPPSVHHGAAYTERQ